jgi:hypothetical protein
LSSSASTALGGPAVHIQEVELAPRGELLHANLERPNAGDPALGFCVPVSGWALSPDGANVTIEIRQGRQVLRRLARSVERPDIASAFPALSGAERSGFSLLLDAVKLPSTFEMRVSGIVGEADEEPIARVRGSRQVFEPLPTKGPAPLIVTTLGRSGSTLLMTLLSLHPQVAAFHPADYYDSRPFAYQLEAAIGMASPASRIRLLDSAVQGEAWWLGRASVQLEEFLRLDEPLRELLLGAPVERLLRSAVDQAAAFAGELGAAQERMDVRYAAEKCGPTHLPRLMRELCAGGREIFLVRDFRDVVASMLAFNAKRGYAAFGREQVDSDEQFVRWQAGIAAALAASWRERGDGALLLRYEELVADVPAAITHIIDYLELDGSPSLVGGIVDRARAQLDRIQHRTVQDASASSGRWQTDLPPALKELANEAFAGPLQEFGYS